MLKTLTAAPANILGLNAGTLAKGAPADLVLIDPDDALHRDRERSCTRAPATRRSKAAISKAAR